MYIYSRVLNSLKKRGWISESDSVLVLAAGELDRKSMIDAGLKNVVISNLAYHAGQEDYAPFQWQRIDAEKIDAPEDSYDWAVIHAGLHHLACPAMGVCEMFRVARKGILCFEARDSLLMRTAVRWGLTADYEVESPFLSAGKSGGYRDGPIPNYVYRWTEREFEKVVNSYAPSHTHRFFYDYGLYVPTSRFKMAKSPAYRMVGAAIDRLAPFIERVAPTQCNQFSFGALKNCAIQPWLDERLEFRMEYLAGKYDAAAYRPKV